MQDPRLNNLTIHQFMVLPSVAAREYLVLDWLSKTWPEQSDTVFARECCENFSDWMQPK